MQYREHLKNLVRTYKKDETGNMAATCPRGSGIEGIGRPRVEPSFIRVEAVFQQQPNGVIVGGNEAV